MKASIPSDAVYSFESQAKQFPKIGEPGMSWEIQFVDDMPDCPIHCLLYRNRKGIVIGILYYYERDMDELERAGNVNIYVRPDRQRRGIGSALALACDQRFHVDFEQQRYTREGLALIEHLLYRRHVEAVAAAAPPLNDDQLDVVRRALRGRNS